MKQSYWALMKHRVLIYSILLGMSYLTITYHYDLWTKLASEGVYYRIQPRNTSLSQGSFNIEEIERFRKDMTYGNMAISYTYKEAVTIEGMGKQQKAVAIETNSDYKRVYGLSMEEGNFFNESGCQSEDVVLNETLAFQLFGSNQIIGEEVKVNGKSFKVLGIARDKGKNEGAVLYLKGLVEQGEDTVYVEEIGVYSYMKQNLLNHEKMQQILQALNKDKDEYKIVKVKKYQWEQSPA